MQGGQNCDCGIPARHQVVKKPGNNQGKAFLGCGSYPAACKFFHWVGGQTQPPPAPKKAPVQVTPVNQKIEALESPDLFDGLSVSPVQEKKKEKKRSVRRSSDQLFEWSETDDRTKKLRLMKRTAEELVSQTSLLRGMAYDLLVQLQEETS